MENLENNLNVEYEFSAGDVVIDPYTCDLNLFVDKECLLAYPLTNDGFCSMWAGCRSTYGVAVGRVAFEVHLLDYTECSDLAKDDLEPNMIRVGWSLNYSPLQLAASIYFKGESEFSFGFASNGKKCCNKTFEDYGDSFEKGDSIAAYLDFTSDKQSILISYSKNGIDQGIAFRLDRAKLDAHLDRLVEEENHHRGGDDVDETKLRSELAVFFPHVLTKNVVFEVNFGQRVSLIGDEPFAPIKSEFELIQKMALDARFCNEPRKPNKNDYELIMLVGLPGCGKSYWADHYLNKNIKKNFCIIGIGRILEKMKMLGIRKKANQNQAGELTLINSLAPNSASKLPAELLDKILKCMNSLMSIAAHTMRNVIIDQPNLYLSDRRRKLKLFEGFQTKAVVIVPNDDVYKERLDSIQSTQSDESSKLNLAQLINNMKIGFSLPKASEFDSIEYTELKEEQAQKLVEFYNSQGVNDRLSQLLARRAKRNEEIRKKFSLSPTMLMRPIYRPPYTHSSSSTVSASSGAYPRPIATRYGQPMISPTMIGGVRRPFLNPAYANQFLRRGGTVYPMDVSNIYLGQQVVYATPTGGVYSTPIIATGAATASPLAPPNQADPSMLFGQWPHQQLQHQQQQQIYHAQQAVYAIGGSGSGGGGIGLAGINPYIHHAYPLPSPQQQQQQQHAPQLHQYAPIYGSSNPQQQHQHPHQTQNSWDPVVSTNLSHSISDSVYSTNLVSSMSATTSSTADRQTTDQSQQSNKS